MQNYHIYSAKEKELFSALGELISRFSSLEFCVFELAEWALQMKRADAASLMSSFLSFSLVLTFAHKACKARLDSHEYLNSLVEQIRELAGDRNFIAHTCVVAHGNSGPPNESDWTDTITKIGPHIRTHLAGSSQKREAMEVTEVSELIEDTKHLTKLFMEFSDTLRLGQPLSGKFLKPAPPRRPRLAQRQGKGGTPP